MLAGFGCADITPPPGPPLPGSNQATSEPSVEVVAPLSVRAAAFEAPGGRFCLVSVDAWALDAEWSKRLRWSLATDYGLDPEAVLMLATHSHGAPVVTAATDTEPPPAWSDQVRRGVHTAVQAALTDPVPVRLAAGMASCPMGVFGRAEPPRSNHPALTADPRLRVLRVDGPSQRPIGVLFHYACQPAVLPTPLGLIHGDYPATARAEIESALSCPALFLTGCSRDVWPRWRATESIDARGDGFAQINSVGQAMAEAVRTCVETLRPRVDPRLLVEAEAWPDSGAAREQALTQSQLGPVVLLSLAGDVDLAIGQQLERIWQRVAATIEPWPVSQVTAPVTPVVAGSPSHTAIRQAAEALRGRWPTPA